MAHDMTQVTIEKTTAELEEELRLANLAFDELTRQRKKDVEYFSHELDKQTLQKARAVLVCKQRTADLEAAKEETKRQRGEAPKLRKKLAAETH